MSKSCAVCSRTLKTDNPQKGDICWKLPIALIIVGFMHKTNLRKSPSKIKTSITTIEKNGSIFTLIAICAKIRSFSSTRWNKENRRYCSRKCHNKLKSCQKRQINKTINLLHYLEHDYRYGGHGWLPPQTISEVCNKQSAGFTKSTVSIMLKRWREAGIIEAQLQRTSNNYHYRFNPQGLKGMKVSEFVYNWNNMSYAEKDGFQIKMIQIPVRISEHHGK